MKRPQRTTKVIGQALRDNGHAWRRYLNVAAVVCGCCLVPRVLHAEGLALPSPASGGWLELANCPIFVIDAIDLPAQENGILSGLEVQTNQEVKADQRIGQLDATAASLEESLAAKQAQVANALATDDSDLRFTQLVVEEAKIALESYEKMEARGAVSDAEMRTKKLAVSQAELKVQHALQAIEQLRLKARLAQASVIVAAERTRRHQLTAPFDGTIAEIYRHRGEWVQAGQPIVKLIRLDELRVDFYVPLQSVDVASLMGAPVSVTAQRAGADVTTFSGRITHYEPQVSSTGEVRVHATLQNQKVNGHWLLLPGMSATMKIQASAAPATAVLRRSLERR